MLQSFGLFAALVALKVVIGVGLVFYSSAAHRRDASIFMRSSAVNRPQKSTAAVPSVPGGSTPIQHGGTTPLTKETIMVTPRNFADAIAARSANSNNFLHQHSSSHHLHIDRANQSRSNSITNHFSDLNDTISAASSPLSKRRTDQHRVSPPSSPISSTRDIPLTIDTERSSSKTSRRSDSVERDTTSNAEKNNAQMARSLLEVGDSATHGGSTLPHSSSGGIAIDALTSPELSPAHPIGELSVQTDLKFDLVDRGTEHTIDLNYARHGGAQNEAADEGDGFWKAQLAASDPSLKERLDLLEELSSMERYTVYKGRII